MSALVKRNFEPQKEWNPLTSVRPRELSIVALGDLGEKGRGAISLLQGIQKTDPNERIRIRAGEALRKIKIESK